MLGLLLFLAALAAANVVAVRQLRAVFPSRQRYAWAALILGNLLLLLIPFAIRSRTGVFTYARPILSPPFVLWQFFAFTYTTTSLVGLAAFGLLRALNRVRASWPQFWRKPTQMYLTAFALAAAIGTYQALVPIRSYTVPVRLASVPPEFDGYRIALLSDLHVGLFTRESRVPAIVRAIEAARADLVVIAGDLIDDDPIWIPKLARGLQDVHAPDGVYAVLGNHEIYGLAALALDSARASLPFRLLVNESARIERGTATLALVGLGEVAALQGFPSADRRIERYGPDWARALADVRPGDFVVAAAHQPALYRPARSRGVPLTLAGHTHGGQLGIPALRWCLAALFLPYHMGSYYEDNTALYVTTGAGYWVLPIRLGVPPEIVTIELVAGSW